MILIFILAHLVILLNILIVIWYYKVEKELEKLFVYGKFVYPKHPMKQFNKRGRKKKNA
jgi:hypothetical protein